MLSTEFIQVGAGIRRCLDKWREPRYGRVDREEREQSGWNLPKRLQSVLAFIGGAISLLALRYLFAVVPWRREVTSLERESMHEMAAKHLVVASFSTQNVTWIESVPSSWERHRYIMDDPNPAPPNLAVPFNRGREAMAYLTHIIDNYDNFPDYAVYVHGHERSWHQQAHMQQKIRALNLTALDEENYISFRCGNQQGCEKQPYLDTQHVNWSGEAGLCHFWKTITGERCPRYVGYKCCAQFAVTRQAVLARSKAQWTKARAPLMGPDPVDNWLTGMLYEKVWHMLFGAPSEHCPSQERCERVHFSHAIICDSDTDRNQYEGDAWMETKCYSAFDGLEPDAYAGDALEKWYGELLDTYARVRGEAGQRQRKAYQALALEEAGRDVKAPP